MARKPTYQELIKKLETLEQETQQRKRAEKALRRTEAMASALLNASADSAVLMDVSGSILAINEFGLKTLSVAGNTNVIRQNIFDLLPPEVAAARKARIKKVIRTGEAAQFEDQMKGRMISNTVYPIFDRQGNVEKLAIYSRDITNRKLAEQDRIQKEKLQGVLEMAGAASHELSQPLQIISGYTELLSREISKDHPLYEHVQEIKNHTNRLGEITKKIMRITKYETVDYLDGIKIIDINKASNIN
jgi:PAS domain S-box-containing protein